MKTVTVSGARLHVLDEGAGPPLLLVHGFPLDHTMWQAQIEAFAGQYRVIAPDLRGFGQSDGATHTLGMKQHADDLRSLLDALGVREPVHYAAISMGAYVGWHFWRHDAARLRSLILCDTKAAADSPDAVRGRLAMAAAVEREGPQVALDAMLPRLLAPHSATRRPAAVEAVRRMILGTSAQTIAAAQRGMAERPDAMPWLGEIRLPVLLIVGQEDAISPPAEMRCIAAAIPGSRLVEIAGAGHMTPLEAPEAVNAALREFLEPQHMQ